MSASGPIIDRRRDLSKVRSTLEPWLSDRLGGAAVEVGDFSYPRGAGVSNETILFVASWAHDGESHSRPLVLRMEPHEKPLFLEPVFEEQFRLLQVLRDEDGIRVPEPLWFEADARLLGQRFFIMDRVQGRVPVTIPSFNVVGWLADSPPPQRRNLWNDAMDQLCRIHRVDPVKVGFLNMPQWGGTPLEQQLSLWERSLWWATDDSPPAELLRIMDWLEAEVPASAEPGLSWGDARIGNMLFDDECNVTAVLDWEQASLGGPMLDLGWWLFYDDYTSTCQGTERLLGLGSRTQTVEFWEASTGLQAHDLHWYEIFAGYKLALLTCRLQHLGHGVQGRPLVEANAALTRTIELLDDQRPARSVSARTTRQRPGQRRVRS